MKRKTIDKKIENIAGRARRLYYSVDINLRPVEKPDIESLKPGTFYLHTGQPRTYDCLIQRFSVWSGFTAMWAGIATAQQAAIMVENIIGYYIFNANAGIRTLSPWKKCMIPAQAAIFILQGPVWINANYMVFRGLVQ